MGDDNNHVNLLLQSVCRYRIKLNGMWFDHTFNKDNKVFMIQLILITLVARLFHSVFRHLNQQKFVSYALGGVCIGYWLGKWRQEWAFFPVEEIIVVRVASSLGILYYAFIIGVKMDITVLPKMVKRGSLIGLISFGAPCMTIFLLMLREDFPLFSIQGYNTKPLCFIFAGGLSMTRFPNVAIAFEELDLLTSDLGQLVMSSAMVNEVFTCIFVTLGIQFRPGQSSDKPWPILSIIALLLFTFFVIRPLMVWIVKTTPVGHPVSSGAIVSVLAGALGMAFLGDCVGSSHLGIFAMGIVVPSGPPLASEIVMRSEVVVRDILMPLFYLSMGYNVGLAHVLDDYARLPEEDHQDLIKAVSLVVIGCIVKFAAVSATCLFCKLPTRDSLLVGLMMNIKGPFDMWLCTRWVASEHMKKTTYASLLLAQIAINAVVTPVIVQLYNIYIRIHQPGAKIRCIQEINPHDLRILFCVHEEGNVPGLITLLEASHTCAAKLRPYLVHLNELVGRAVPLVSPTRRKLEVVLSKKIGRIERAFAKHIKETEDLVMMGIFTVIAPYRTMHENICRIALDESIPLIIVPFNKKHHEDDVQASAIRHLNSNVQDNAPCTVGLLMDNGLGKCLTRYSNFFSCNVAVIFIGGADDREALALGVRMAGHKQVKLTVLRLIVQIRTSDQEEDSNLKEKLLDNSFIEGFITNNSVNTDIQYCEAVAGNSRQALNRIRALGSDYDLVIVGRERRASESIFDELMVEWSEYPELGMIGDFVSSSDFNDGKTSALVIQRSTKTDDAAAIRRATSSSQYFHRRNLSVDHQST